MAQVTVRQINRSDFEAVTRLLAELGRPTPEARDMDMLERVFRQHVDRDDTYSLLAEADGKAVGFLSMELRYRLNYVTREAWIPDFIVNTSYRGTGVGHRLFMRAKEIARQFGCHRLVLESGHHRAVAHQFYEEHGMVHTGRVYALDLSKVAVEDSHG